MTVVCRLYIKPVVEAFTLCPLPSGRDSVGIGGDVQWNGLTVLYTFWSVDSLLTSELHYGTNHETGCTAHWEFGTIRCQQQDQPAGMYEYR